METLQADVRAEQRSRMGTRLSCQFTLSRLTSPHRKLVPRLAPHFKRCSVKRKLILTKADKLRELSCVSKLNLQLTPIRL